jgi:3-hydroxyisobutyrate dehydrogenase-like beta-hydroxyacid dehydrogenase
MATIALLYPGSVGRALAEKLAPLGHDLVTCLEGRSAATQQNATERGIRSLSFDDVVASADLALSIVPPDAARRVAEEYGSALRRARGAAPRRPIFIDANSIAPATAEEIGAIIRDSGARFVDGVFMGPAASITSRTVLALSGEDAAEAAGILRHAVTVEVLGPRIGEASALKMSIALVTKALLALFLEMACAAQKSGCLDAVLAEMRRSYAGTMEFLERNLPTFPRNAQRRLVEMEEAKAWMSAIGERGTMTEAASLVLGRVAALKIDAGEMDFAALLRRIVAAEPLSREP